MGRVPDAMIVGLACFGAPGEVISVSPDRRCAAVHDLGAQGCVVDCRIFRHSGMG